MKNFKIVKTKPGMTYKECQELKLKIQNESDEQFFNVIHTTETKIELEEVTKLKPWNEISANEYRNKLAHGQFN